MEGKISDASAMASMLKELGVEPEKKLLKKIKVETHIRMPYMLVRYVKKETLEK